MIAPSPSTVGTIATRTSSRASRPFGRNVKRPSCGSLCSAMSSFARTLTRLMTPEAWRLGIRSTSCMMPSTRRRATSESPWGRKCKSLARSSIAWTMIELTSLIGGASEGPSVSRSASSSNEPGSTSSITAARSPTSCARASRRSSKSMSSGDAIAKSSGLLLTRRSSSMTAISRGSEIATFSRPSTMR